MDTDHFVSKATQNAANDVGKPADLARLAKVNPGTVSRIINGQTHKISLESWLRLYPYLRRHLPEDPQYHKYADGAKNFSAGEAHPCAGKPPWLADLCRAWDFIPLGEQGLVEAVARAALSKHAPAADRRRAKAG